MTQWLGALDPGLMIVGIALAGVFLPACLETVQTDVLPER